MKKVLAVMVIFCFLFTSLAIAKPAEKAMKGKATVEKKMTMEKKVKAEGKKEMPKGVAKAAEKGKGEKKGLFSKWFGKDKDVKAPAKKAEKAKAAKKK